MATPKKMSRESAPAPARMRQLYRRLSQAGFSPKFVREYILPPSWQDEMADGDGEYQSLLAFLSQHLGVDAASLQDSASPLRFDGSQARLFRGRDVFEEPDATQQLAQGVARVALSGLPKAQPTYVPPALVLRRRLMLEGRPWVGFRDLLSYCWQIHIPVLHVPHLPATSAKHKGIAVEVGGVPAIVLCQRHTSPAWHLKALAHEIGHLTEEDADLRGRPATTEEQARLMEQAESAATRYATQLVTGGQEVTPDTRPYRLIQDLVEATYQRAHSDKIDPGYLIVRRGAVTGKWPEASAALKVIDDREGGASAHDLVNAEVAAHVNAASIPRASLSFFQRLTGAHLYRSTPVSPAAAATGPDSRLLADEGLAPPAMAARSGAYPEELLTRYRALTRQRWHGGLRPEQEEELAGVREQIQAISSRDPRGQEAARRVQDVNAALEALEAEVDSRIAQRRAEMVERQTD